MKCVSNMDYIQDEIEEVTKENAYRDMCLAMKLNLTKDGKFYSIMANKYRDKLAEYAVYCKSEDVERFCSMCQSLIDSIKDMKDLEWFYEAWVVESTVKLMHALDGDVDWDRVRDIVSDQGHTCNTMSDVAQMLIAYSPNGLLFVDEIVKPRSIYKEMKGLRNAYATEVNRRMRQEKRERKELGKRLVMCLDKQVSNLNKKIND